MHYARYVRPLFREQLPYLLLLFLLYRRNEKWSVRLLHAHSLLCNHRLYPFHRKMSYEITYRDMVQETCHPH